MLLVTTALKETWGLNQDIVFLGEWCKAKLDSGMLQNRKFETIPYVWADREQMYSDVNYLRGLHQRVLEDLTTRLNGIHKTQHSCRFWKILTGVWLGFFVHILYHRWSTVNSALSRFNDLETFVLKDSLNSIPPIDCLTFVSEMVSDQWNHSIFACIFEFQNSVRCHFLAKDKKSDKEDVRAPEGKGESHRFKSLLLKGWNSFFSIFSNENDIFFINTYLSMIEEINLALRFGQPPLLNRSEAPDLIEHNPEWRDWQCQFAAESEFENFVARMIPLHLPISYLEGFKSLKLQSVHQGWPKSPKIIFTSNSHIFEDLTKCYIGLRTENGSKLVIGQHGGGALHGISFQNEHELDTCDKFLSTGLGNSYHSKMIPVGQFFHKSWRYDPAGKGLLIELSAPLYSNCYSSTVQSSDFLSYQDDQISFMNQLEPEIREMFIVRLHVDKPGWNNAKHMWQTKFPKMTLNEGFNSIVLLYSKSRLIVCTYPGTSYNESLAANAPTIIFWDPAYSQMHPSSKKSFDELRKVGIFHDTPQSAANHINRIWNDIDAWWKSTDVQLVVKLFTQLYACSPKNLVLEIEKALKSSIKEKS